MNKIEKFTSLILNQAHIYKYFQHFEIIPFKIIDTTKIKLQSHASERIVCLEVQVTRDKYKYWMHM